MKAFILAAGRGQRLSPLTDHTPKPLVEIKGQSLISRHIHNLADAGFNDIVVNVSWLKHQIINHINNHMNAGINLTISDENNRPLETGGGMLRALPIMDHQIFLAVNADVFTDFDFNSINSLSKGDLVHLVLVNNPKHNPSGDFSSINGRLTLKSKTHVNHTYSGIGIFHPDLFINCERDSAFSVVPLIKNAIKNNQASAQIFEGQWSDVGTLERLRELNA